MTPWNTVIHVGWTCYIHLQYITLKKRAVYSSEIRISFYQTAWHIFLEDSNLHFHWHANFKLLSLVYTECVSSVNKVYWQQFIYPTTLNRWYKNNWTQTVYGIYHCILIPMYINYPVCSFLWSQTWNKKPHQTHIRVVLSTRLRTTEMLSHLAVRRITSPTAPYSAILLSREFHYIISN
jgi:hypothetical protein